MFPLKERRKLWAWHYAHLSFSSCGNCCRFALKENITKDHPIYYGLVTSVYVLYARPFIKSYGLEKLSQLIVPEDQKSLHEHLLQTRSKLYAHVDASTPYLPDGDLAIDVRIKTLKSGGLTVEALACPSGEIDFGKIAGLTDGLLNKCRYHSLKIINRFMPDFPKHTGTFHLSITDETNAFIPDLSEQAET